ncbi:hypothetical protein ELQ92_06030 [Labedella populi]|uniref:Uncharacterized protein n=1 Tax=Labedella populi TaxID=2498850 RepID=A0A3S3ZQA3_9MICO|nr:hypothetical protein [Labedella populi]RWZ64324.1 hypothetical protein ELQ92_06030 [Labedella populi]
MSYPPSSDGQYPWRPQEPRDRQGGDQQAQQAHDDQQAPVGQQAPGSQPAPADQQAPGSQPAPYGQQPTAAYGQQPTAPYGQPPAPYGQPTSAYPTQAYPPTGQQPPSSPYPPTDPSLSQPRKKKRGRAAVWIAAAVVLVLLVAGGIVAGVLGTGAHAPEREVEEYLSALVDGDVDEAFAVSGEDASDGDLLLTDDVYADVDDRISGYEVGDTTISGDTAEVETSISQGDETYDATFTLTKAEKAFVVFDTWALQAPELGVVSYSVDGPEETAVTVAGIDTTDVEVAESGAVDLRALPGTYTISLAGDDAYFAAEPITVSVVGFGPDAATATTADGAESSTLAVTLTEGAVTAAQEAVDAYIDGCAAATEFRPEGCPFAAHGENPSYDYTNCVWTLDPRPEFTIGEYADGEWAVSTDSPGSAELSCDVSDPATGATGTSTAGPMDVEVAGAITGFDDDGATYVP